MRADQFLLPWTSSRATRVAVLPASLRFVAWLFLTTGAVGLALTAYHAWHGQFILNACVVGLPIGCGLVRLKPGWHTCAIGAALLVIVVVLLLFVRWISGWGDFVISYVPTSTQPLVFAIASLVIVTAFMMAWSIRILKYPHIERLFVESGTARIASTIRAGLVVLAALSVSRITGGFEQSLSYTFYSRSSFSIGPGLRDLPVIQPLIIEVRADEQPYYYCVTWSVTRSLNKMGEVTRTSKSNWAHYGDMLAPEWVLNSPDRLIVDVGQPALSGLYWLPLFKPGRASIDARLTGTGRYRSVSYQWNREDEFTRLGPSTTASLKKYVRRQIGKEAIAIARKSATQAKGLSRLEQTARESLLGRSEVFDLATEYRLLGDRYHQVGSHADAIEVYQRGVLALELLAISDSIPSLVTPERMHWIQTLENKNKLANMYNHVAWKLATDPRPEARNGARSIQYAEKACQITDWKRWECVDTLAAASADAGNFEKAVQWQEMALSLLAKGSVSANNASTAPGRVEAAKRRVDAAQRRLALYQSGAACREPGSRGN